MNRHHNLGIDVGSMSVKVVLIDSNANQVIHQEYKQHQSQQAEALYNILTEMQQRFNIFNNVKTSITGSGGMALAPLLNAAFIQEVSAIAATVEKDHPETRTAIDIGGQDAKIVIWQGDPTNSNSNRFLNMNDKCAGGTGATLDRVLRKLGLCGIPLDKIVYSPERVHPVASRCGVFAETDINSLMKQGVPAEDCLISLCDAIVQQNFSSLPRGRTIVPNVILLGGPHVYCHLLYRAWVQHLSAFWKTGLEEASSQIIVPNDGLFFAARGAILESRRLFESHSEKLLKPLCSLDEFVNASTSGESFKKSKSLITKSFSPSEFKRKYYSEVDEEKQTVSLSNSKNVFIGLDAGSTSMKGVIIDESGSVIAHDYLLASDTPLEDAKRVLIDLGQTLNDICPSAQISAFTVTGYAREYLQAILGADYSVVETVAHVQGAQFFAGDIDVILDVGGQDIKVLFLEDGVVTDFKLNTQCSAGNGFYLQNAAARFGVSIDQYAAAAFSAHRMPPFKTGCAVFLESDIVSFQQMGWTPSEILAGLAYALPKNVWEYVVQEPSPGSRGKRFLLQGGTHKNLAVIKAQVDYIQSRVPDAIIKVHPYTAEAGAIGAAIMGIEKWKETKNSVSNFIGFEELSQITCHVERDESTRCNYCSNHCLRTFVTAKMTNGQNRSITLAPCDKGIASDVAEVRSLTQRQKYLDQQFPNFVKKHENDVFNAGIDVATCSVDKASIKLMKNLSGRKSARKYPKRIGVPQIQNLWRYAPFFNAYLKMTVPGHPEIVWSGNTSHEQWLKWGQLNRAELCFPGKYVVAHVGELLERGVDMILNPTIIKLDSKCKFYENSAACPATMASPDVVKATFTSEYDAFARANIRYTKPVLHMTTPEVFESELYRFSSSEFGVTRQTHRKIFRTAWTIYEAYYRNVQLQAKEELSKLVMEDRVGILFLGRPYHYDTGLNHGIPQLLQKRGYAIFTIESLPCDNETLEILFGKEISGGKIRDYYDISDVWKHSLVENSNRKVWGAKIAARMPNLAIVDFSNFKCGIDASILHVVENIARYSGTPYFSLHDMDQNKPTGSLGIRIDTIDYYLKKYERQLSSRNTRQRQQSIAQKEYGNVSTKVAS